jgi:hypothetical protein
MAPFIVSLTDFAITLLCMIFCWKLWTQPADKRRLNYNFFGLFATAGVAALLGGIVHIYDQKDELAFRTFWVLTLLNVGLASYNVWLINIRLVLTDSLSRMGTYAARASFLIYVLFVLFVNDQFYVAILSYIPPAFVLFCILFARVLRERNRFTFYGLGGLLLTFVAAAVQYKHVEFTAIYLDHNSLYHIIQALGLWGLYLFGSRIARWNI